MEIKLGNAPDVDKPEEPEDLSADAELEAAERFTSAITDGDAAAALRSLKLLLSLQD